MFPQSYRAQFNVQPMYCEGIFKNIKVQITFSGVDRILFLNKVSIES